MKQKFRAWDKKENKWVDYPIYIDGEGNIYWEHYERGLQEADDLIVMQYTGLEDRNCVKIFEGDIVSMIVCEDKAEYLGDVVFESGCFCLNIILDGTKYKVTALEWKETETIITVIGNIYQNKDLI